MSYILFALKTNSFEEEFLTYREHRDILIHVLTILDYSTFESTVDIYLQLGTMGLSAITQVSTNSLRN